MHWDFNEIVIMIMVLISFNHMRVNIDLPDVTLVLITRYPLIPIGRDGWVKHLAKRFIHREEMRLSISSMGNKNLHQFTILVPLFILL